MKRIRVVDITDMLLPTTLLTDRSRRSGGDRVVIHSGRQLVNSALPEMFLIITHKSYIIVSRIHIDKKTHENPTGQGSISYTVDRCVVVAKTIRKIYSSTKTRSFLERTQSCGGFDYSTGLADQTRRVQERASTPYYYKFRAARRWILISAIAVLTGFVAVFMTVCTRRLSELRFEWISQRFDLKE